MISVVVPYPATNSSVRTRALHWIDRAVAAGDVERDAVSIAGPGFGAGARRPDGPVLLLRNIRRLTRGRREAALLAAGTPGVYDLDDGLPWDDGKLPGLGRWWKRPFPLSLVARRAAGAAERVIAGNDTIADWAADHCDDVRIVPTCVEPDDYDRRSDWELDDHPTIGWIGSPATEPYLRSIAPALAAIADRHGATLELVSGPGEVPAELAPFARRVTWEPGIERRIATWDLGVMPLADGVYERAKCGYKLLQYAASGVPAVASPVGVNAAMIERMDAVAATTVAEWTEALDAVVSEPSPRRAARAAAGFELARAYSYDRWYPTWIEAAGW